MGYDSRHDAGNGTSHHADGQNLTGGVVSCFAIADFGGMVKGINQK